MPLAVIDHHLARLDVADEAGADDVERAGFGSEDPGAVEIAEHQRADAERVAAADHLLGRQRDQRVGAFDLAQRVDEARIEVALAAGGDEVQDRLGVGGRREDRALLLQRALHGQGIGDVAVVGDREAAVGEFGKERLDVAQAGAAGGGVAGMADGAVARQAVDDGWLGESVADQADMALDVELRAVKGDDARRFLAAMLEGMQAERDDRRRVLMAEDAEHAAFVVEISSASAERDGLPGQFVMGQPRRKPHWRVGSLAGRSCSLPSSYWRTRRSAGAIVRLSCWRRGRVPPARRARQALRRPASVAAAGVASGAGTPLRR